MAIASKVDPSARQLPGGKGTVLVMDDETVMRDVLSAMLEHEGYEAVSALDGEEAVELYRRSYQAGHPFNVAILDLSVPGHMGAEETISRLLEIDPRARVILTSGYSHDPVVDRFREHGFKAVLTKPFNYEELEAVIHRVAEGL